MLNENNLVVTLTVEDFFSRLETTLEKKIVQKLEALQLKEEASRLPELLTRRQVADYLSISLTTVDTLARDGILRKHFIGGSPRFKREEVRAVADTWKPYQRTI
jgi:excisionase family DNA binding protein